MFAFFCPYGFPSLWLNWTLVSVSWLLLRTVPVEFQSHGPPSSSWTFLGASRLGLPGWLFSLPGRLLPQVSAWLTLWLPRSPSQWGLPSPFLLRCQPCYSPDPLNCSNHLLYLFGSLLFVITCLLLLDIRFQEARDFVLLWTQMCPQALGPDADS